MGADTRVLLTGGAGFIGSHIVKGLLARECSVEVIDDLCAGVRARVPPRAALHVVDITDTAAVRAIVERFQPDVVCHHAAQSSVPVGERDPTRDATVNVLGSLSVLQATVGSSVQRFIFASTGGAVYGEVAHGRLAKVSTPPMGLSAYACSKLSAEIYVRAFGLKHGFKTNILRYANIYGPSQSPYGEGGVVAIFCDRALRGEPLVINGASRVGDSGCVRDYVYVEDVVEANLRAIAGGITRQTIHIATGRGCSTLSLARQIKRLTGSSSPVTFGPPRIGDWRRSVLEPEANARMTRLEQGLRRTIDSFRLDLATGARTAPFRPLNN